MDEVKKLGADRTNMLAEYHKAVGLPEIEAEAAPVVAESDGSDIVDPKSESQPVVEEAEAAPVVPAAKEVVVDPGVKKAVEKPEENKMVPLGALHEAREKYKAKNLETRKLQEQLGAKDQELADVKARLASVEETIRKAQAGESLEPAGDEVAKQLAEENKQLKEAQAKAEQEKQQEAQKAAAAHLQNQIKSTDEALVKEGFPGFAQFTRDVYVVLKAKVDAGELEEKDVTPAMWAQAYKEEVYPKKKEIFVAQSEQEKKAAKLRQKKAANLVNNPGEGPTPKPEEDLDAPQTAESYLRARKRIF